MLPTQAIVPHFKSRARQDHQSLGGGATPASSQYQRLRCLESRGGRLTEPSPRTAHCEDRRECPSRPVRFKHALARRSPRRRPTVVGESFYQRALKQRDTGGAPLELGASLGVYSRRPKATASRANSSAAQWDPWRDFASRKETLAKTDISRFAGSFRRMRARKW